MGFQRLMLKDCYIAFCWRLEPRPYFLVSGRKNKGNTNWVSMLNLFYSLQYTDRCFMPLERAISFVYTHKPRCIHSRYHQQRIS